MLVTLGSAWRVLFGLFQILFTLYVFSRLSVRFEIIVVAILGLIYVAVCSVGFWIGSMLARSAVGTHITEKQFMRIWYRLGIQDAALFVISLICLFELLNAL